MNKNFQLKVELNWKIALTKGKTNQNTESQIEKKKQQKLWLKDEIKSKKKLQQKGQEKKLK